MTGISPPLNFWSAFNIAWSSRAFAADALRPV
jgi:hypothetical protein